jgi:hypothetical protein
MRQRFFGRRRVRHPWMALLPAFVAAAFAALAIDDEGSVAAALPYLSVVVLTILYVARPTLVLWAILFATFVSYSVFIVIAPLVGFDGVPTSQWLAQIAVGVVPCTLLWYVRPKRMDDKVV